MKWWGWGEPAKRNELSESAKAMLREELGPADPAEPIALESVRLPAAQVIPPAVRGAVGADAVLDGDEDRLLRSGGKSYPGLVRARTNAVEGAPDAVLMPAGASEVAAVLEACAAESIAVVPFGGGTSVVGGVDAVRGQHRAVISLDLTRMRACEVDRVSLSARLGPGLRGPQAESVLAEKGFTKYVKAGGGHYEKVAGKGPNVIKR